MKRLTKNKAPGRSNIATGCNLLIDRREKPLPVPGSNCSRQNLLGWKMVVDAGALDPNIFSNLRDLAEFMSARPGAIKL
jgi:hypothetical protein